MQFHTLTILNKTQETADTVTIELAVPTELENVFYAFQPGQYLTIKMDVGGHEIRRSYSMSSSPLEKKLAVTVKRIQGGRISPILHDQLKAGDTLTVSEPEGRFTLSLDPEKRRTYYFFAAGSGITPIMSHLRSILEAEPMSTIFLLYGNRTEEDIIFKNELDQLVDRYTGQLQTTHTLSRPKREGGGGLFGMFKKGTMQWQGLTGRIDAKLTGRFLDENMAQGPEKDCVYMVCGPGNMPDTVKAALMGRGVDSAQIHVEHFLQAGHVPGEGIGTAGDGASRLVVHLRGRRYEYAMPDGATLLDTMVREKLDAPYSCTSGACSTCVAKVLEGNVKMDVCYALDEAEVKAGYCLTCQARPKSPVVEISFDQ